MLSTLTAALALALLPHSPAQADVPKGPIADVEALPEGAALRLGTMRLLHPTRVTDAAMGPGGEWFATGAEDGLVRLWDANEGRLLGVLDSTGYGAIVGLAVSPDGARLAVGTRRQCLILFDLATRAQIFLREEGGSLPAWSRDGSRLYVGEYGPMVRAFDPKTAAVIEEIDHSPFTVEELLPSPCGGFLAVRALNRPKLLKRGGTADQDTSLVSVRDLGTLELHHQIGFEDASATALCFSPDGAWLYISDDLGRVDSYDTKARKEGKVLAGDGLGTFALSADPDGKHLSLARLNGVVERISTDPLERVGQWSRSRLSFERLLVRPSDGALICVSAGIVEVRGAADGAPILAPARHLNVVTSLRYSPDGQFVVSGGHDSSLRLWRAATGEPVGEPRLLGGWLFDVDWLPGGLRVAAACRDGGIYLFDLATKDPGERLEVGRVGVTSIDVHPSGSHLVAGVADGRLVVVALGEGGPSATSVLENVGGIHPVVRFSGEGLSGVAFGADLRRYRLDSLEELAQLGEFGAPAVDMDVSDDGRLVAVGLADGNVRVIELESGRRRPPLPGLTSRVHAVAFSPDGRLVAAVGEFDDTLLVWDAGTGAEVLRRNGQGSPLSAVAFSPDGRRLATGAYDGTILIWDLPGAQ